MPLSLSAKGADATISEVVDNNPIPPRRFFASLIKRREERIDLALAVLLIAKEEYPKLAIEDYVERLDQLAGELRIEVDLDAPPPKLLEGLAWFMHHEQGFSGNADEYYDARNSYLNEVMDRRLGIPITLSIVYLEVARRAGIKLQPVTFPGHFLLKLAANDGDSEDLFLDPYNSGRLMTVDDCRAFYNELHGDATPFSETMLAAGTKRQVVTRVLRNLKAIYLRNQELDRALRTIELMTTVTPWDLDQIRDRGLVHYRLGQIEEAVADLEVYASHAPEGPALDSVRDALRRIHP
jgi:regulator of sirC expression with transglutaminase-like and TPR domain